MRARRAGFSAPLVTVLGVLLVLLTLALTLGYRSRNMTVLVQRSVYVDECENLARLAVLEGLRFLRVHANHEGHAVFGFLRGVDAGGALELAPADLPATVREVGLLPGYALAGPARVTLLRRSLMAVEAEEKVPYEALMVVRLEAKVTGPRRAEATVTREYGVRAVLAAPPRPFDAMTFFLGDPFVLLTRGQYAGDANVAIRVGLERIRTLRETFRQLAVKLADLAREADGAADEAEDQGASGSDVQPLRDAAEMARVESAAYAASVEAPVWPARPWVAMEDGSDTSDSPDEIHYFAWPISLMSLEDEVDLELLNLPRLNEPLARQLAEQEEPIQTLSEALEAEFAREAPVAAQIQPLSVELRTRVLEHVRLFEETLANYKAFQDQLYELGDADRERFSRRFRRLQAVEQRWRADYVFEGRGAAERAREFLNRRPHPTGLTYVDDPDQPLVLELREVAGRVVVVSKGPVELREVRLRDPARDMVAVIGYDLVELVGEVQAAVLSVGGNFRGNGSGRTGTLLLDTLRPTAPLDLIFAGTLRRLETVQSGPDPGNPRPPPAPEAMHVAIGPAPLYRRLER